MGAIILIICLALLAIACYAFLKRQKIVEDNTTTNPTPPTTTPSTGGGGGAHKQNTSESMEAEGKYRDPATGRYAKRPEI